jgi:hypothetical protein
VGRIADPALTELSGLTRTPRGLFAVEDSGAGPVLIALRADGTSAGVTTVSGAAAVDWEDIAAARGELFVADIGDNAADRTRVQVYRVPVPEPGAAVTAPAARLELRYPDGARDAEALLADPVRRQLVVVPKAIVGARAYTAPYAAFADGSATLRRGPRVTVSAATAGSLSADGRIVALRGYGALLVWRRHGDEPLTRTLARAPCQAPADLSKEGQGEALALSARGRSAVTVPEGEGAALRRYAAP